MRHRNNKTPRRLTNLAPGMTLCELSARTGILVEHVSRIVNGRRRLTLDTASKIARALDIPIETVIRAFPYTETPRKVTPPRRPTAPPVDSDLLAPVSGD
jgi:transcriptional regulator with XRE-family HTH domain